jgi:hypothetical protein
LFRDERRVAVESPMPDDEPVIKIVFGVDFKVVKESAVGLKRAMIKIGFEDNEIDSLGYQKR